MGTTRHAVGGFAAGLFAAVALAGMLGMKPQQGGGAGMPIDPRTAELMRQIREAEDQLASASSQTKFWQQETMTDDTEVVRLQSDAAASPSVAFFLDRAKGLSCRSANSLLDARLQEMMALRKVAALKAELGRQ